MLEVDVLHAVQDSGIREALHDVQLHGRWT